METLYNKILGGFFGLCVGDALGVPYEGNNRKLMKKNPATDMIGYGSHFQPAGTWSDDSSLSFCLAESICDGLDYKNIADKFVAWLHKGYWTPYGKAFDIGMTTRIAIGNLKKGIDPLLAGGVGEFSNGNGSLMRILPLAFYLRNHNLAEQFNITHRVSDLTHRTLRSEMACGIYIQFAINLINGLNPLDAYNKMQEVANKFYSQNEFIKELPHFKRILKSKIYRIPESKIKSSGYVIDTLEASLWCVLNNESYVDTVLSAVNLGYDTDTTACVAGGVAGIYYGFKSIPDKWINKIARKNDIKKLAKKFYLSLNKK